MITRRAVGPLKDGTYYAPGREGTRNSFPILLSKESMTILGIKPLEEYGLLEMHFNVLYDERVIGL